MIMFEDAKYIFVNKQFEMILVTIWCPLLAFSRCPLSYSSLIQFVNIRLASHLIIITIRYEDNVLKPQSL